jgi:hypothetical protein
VHQSLFTDPEQFFASRTPSVWQSSLVLAAIGVIGLGLLPPIVALVQSPLIPDGRVLNALPIVSYATSSGTVSVPGVYALIAAMVLVLPSLSWLLLSVVFYGLSWPVASERGFRAVAAGVGAGFVPLLVGNALTVAVTLLAFPGTPAQLWGIGMTIPGRVYVLPPDMGPLFLAVNAVGIGCALWAGYLWTHALRRTRGLSTRQAVAVVALPVLLTIGPL